MKMENELKSEGAGRVTRIHVEPGSTVEKDQVLVELEALAAAGSDAEAGVPSAGGSDA
jgi:multidrug efflux pump subunit AcrA (membrane-fusion protein)